MKLATVVFLKKEDKIILAKKKQHIHVGEEKLDKSKETYNGYGGKFDENFDKDIDDTAIRELKEETGKEKESLPIKKI
jgi:ADP-ribose pyrophosphatase YjhB (NUDIX family)